MILCDTCDALYDSTYYLATLLLLQAQKIRDRGGMENCKTHWHEAGSSALNYISSFEGSLADLLHFDVINF